MEKIKQISKKEKYCYRYNPDRPDLRGEEVGYELMYRQAFQELNTRSGNGFRNRFRRITNIEALYLGCTDGLIGMLDGSIKIDDESWDDNARYVSSEYEGDPSDHAVYLDKSARPIRALVEGLWDKLAKAEISIPDSSHVNIDKELWLGLMHVPTNRFQKPLETDLNFNNIDPKLLRDRIEQLRSVYLSPENLEKLDEQNLSDCWNMPTSLDGKNVAIIDEVESSGFTLRIALELYKRAFPETNFSCMYWSSPRKIYWDVVEEDGTMSQEFAASWAPFWYDAVSASGRGIGDIDVSYSRQSADVRQRIGKYILSAPYNKKVDDGYEEVRDTRSEQTYHDLGLLINRFNNGEAFYRPNPQRLDFMERATIFNGLSSFSEYKGIVRDL